MQLVHFLIAIYLLLLSECAAELPHSRKVKFANPVEFVDFKNVFFNEALTGEKVSVADYLDAHDLKFALLMFGSVGCAKCNEKAQDLSLNYIGKHELFLDSTTKHFELIGVNTDSGNTAQKFIGIISDEDARKRAGYGFVHWTDPAGKSMMEFLVSKGERFGVPFTVMINRQGILWRVSNSEKYSVEELVARVVATVDGHAVPGNTAGNKDEEELKNPITPPSDFPWLNFETPQRLTHIQAIGCSGNAALLADVTNGADYTILQISKDDCHAGGVCDRNFSRMNEAVAACRTKGWRCESAVFSNGGDSSNLCAKASDRSFKGGLEFFDTFASHFDWRYEPYVDTWGAPVKVPNVNGPLVMVFRKDGFLAYSWEGLLPDDSHDGSLRKALSAGFSTRAAGINFQIFADDNGKAKATGVQRFSRVREAAKYTVLNSFDRFCGSCIEELSNWSRPSQLNEYCRESGGFCQVVALESELAPSFSVDDQLSFFNQIAGEAFPASDVNISLALENEAFGDGYGRIFSSYLSPRHKNWNGLFGTVIYDREGKIIADFKSGESHQEDPVIATLKNLRNLP